MRKLQTILIGRCIALAALALLAVAPQLALAQTPTKPTSTTISTVSPSPANVGQLVTISFTVAQGAPAPVPGSVTVTALAGETCTGALNTATPSTGSCSITFATAGARVLTASFPGDTLYIASSDTENLTVNSPQTITTITSDNPDPSVVGQSYSVAVTVAAVDTGNPTGTVAVSDGSTPTPATCSITLAMGSGSCSLTSTSAGTKTITANYQGDSNFDVSSDTDSHVVNKAGTTVAIVSDSPDPSPVTSTYAVVFTLSVQSPGAGTPTGSINVTDGTDSCTATLPALTCSITSATPGTRTLVATYSGDGNFNGSASAGASHTVGPVATTTTINSVVSEPSALGDTVTVNYTVNSSLAGASGSVTVSASTGESCTGTVASGSCVTNSFNTAGTRTITATYQGSSTHNASTSPGVSHTVSKGSTTTTITSDNPDPSLINQPYTVQVTVASAAPGTPSGSVSVSDGNTPTPATCNITLNGGGTGSCSLTTTTSGTKTLTATYGSDSNFNGSSDTESHVVNLRGTNTTLSVAATSVVGQSVTFTYSTTPVVAGSTPTGTVTVRNTGDNSVICTGTVAAGSCNHPFTAPATITARAEYPGDSAHIGSQSTVQTLTVNKANTMLTIVSDTPDPSEIDRTYTVTFTLAVETPGAGTRTGTIVVSDTTDSCTATLPALSCALTSTTLGSKTLNATYSGDANFNTSVASASHEVIKHPTTTTLSVVPSSPVVGQVVTFNYTVIATSSTPTGNVSIVRTSDSSVICSGTVAAGSCTATFAVQGTVNLRAEYSGDDTHAISQSTAQNIAVGKPPTITTITSDSPDPSEIDSDYTVAVSVTSIFPGTPGGTVAISDGDTPTPATCTATLSGGTGSCLLNTTSLGTKTLTATYAGDADFAGSADTEAHTVIKHPTTTTLSAPAAAVVGETVTFNFAVTAASTTPGGSVTVINATTSATICSGTVASGSCSVAFSAPAALTVRANYGGDARHATSSSADQGLTIAKANTTLTIVSDTPDPSEVDTSYLVSFTLTINTPGAGTLSGSVGITDGSASCTAVLPATSCSLTTSTLGAKTLTATYAGNANFNGSSDTEDHQVNQQATATTLTLAPTAVVGQNIAFNYAVSAATAATGNVTVINTADSTTICTGTVAAGTCSASYAAPTSITARAVYPGDTKHLGSQSAQQTVTIGKAGTTLTVTSDNPDPTAFNSPYTVVFTLTVNAPGAGTPSGTVTIGNGTDGCNVVLPATSCVITATALGSSTLTATYPGDTNFLGASDTEAHTVGQATTTTTITGDNPDPSTLGQVVTITYTVTAAASTPTGTVTVNASTGESCNASVAAGQCTITFATAGLRNLTATYGGDTNHTVGTSASVQHTVSKAATTTTITSDNPDPSEVAQGYVVQVSVTSALPGTPTGTVAVSDGSTPTPATCNATLSGGSGSCTLTSVSAGSKTLSASYPGDSSFNASSDTEAHQVDKHPTTTTLSVAPSTVVVGQNVTFTYTVGATASTPTGTVSIVNTADASVICTGTLPATTCAASFPVQASIVARADYNGDATHAISASTTRTVTVNKANTALVITSDTPDPSLTNVPYTVAFTLNVVAPGAGTRTGTVAISDGTDSCTATLPALNCALTSTTPGAKTLTATYSGSASFNTSSDTENHQVELRIANATLSLAPSSAVVGQPVVFTYTVTAASSTPVGTVNVVNIADSSVLCSGTVAAGQCSKTFSSPISLTARADYTGDPNHAASQSTTTALGVSKAVTALSIVSDTPDASAVGEAVSFSVSLSVNAPGSGAPTGFVTVGSGAESCITALVPGTDLATGSCSITYNSVGLRSVTASYGSDGNYTTSVSAAVDHTVESRSTVLSVIADNPDRSLPGEAVTVSVNFGVATLRPEVAGAVPTGSINVTDSVDSCTIALPASSCVITLSTRGPRTLTASYPGDGNFEPSADTEAHLVNRLPLLLADAYSTPQDLAMSANDANANNGNGNDNGVLANDSDPDGDALIVTNAGTITAGGIGGTVVLNANGTFTYTPPPGTTGIATFPVQVGDGFENTSTTATITVQGLVDLVIAKTNGQAVSTVGQPVTYLIVVTNIGNLPVMGALVEDFLPIGLTASTWTCTASGGATCPASGSGNISAVVDLPVAASVEFALTATVTLPFAGPLSNSASVTVPSAQFDTTQGNNTSYDSDDVRLFIDSFDD